MSASARRQALLRRAAIAAGLIVLVIGVMWLEEMRPAPVPAPRVGDARPATVEAGPKDAALVAVSPVAAYTPAPTLTGAVSLQVHVSAATSGEQGTAVVHMASARDLRRVAFTLDFDGSAARILSVSPGDFAGVSEAALQAGQPPDGARGIAMRVERPEGNLPPGDAAIAVIAFEALAESPPRFQLVQAAATDVGGNSVDVAP